MPKIVIVSEDEQDDEDPDEKFFRWVFVIYKIIK